MYDHVLLRAQIDPFLEQLLLRLEPIDICHQLVLKVLKEPVFKLEDLLDELLEFSPGFLGYVAAEALTDRSDDEPNFKVLGSESFLLFDLLFDCKHDLAETVLVHDCNLQVLEGLSLFEQLKDVFFYLNVHRVHSTAFKLFLLLDIGRLDKQKVLHDLSLACRSINVLSQLATVSNALPSLIIIRWDPSGIASARAEAAFLILLHGLLGNVSLEILMRRFLG